MNDTFGAQIQLEFELQFEFKFEIEFEINFEFGFEFKNPWVQYVYRIRVPKVKFFFCFKNKGNLENFSFFMFQFYNQN